MYIYLEYNLYIYNKNGLHNIYTGYSEHNATFGPALFSLYESNGRNDIENKASY